MSELVSQRDSEFSSLHRLKIDHAPKILEIRQKVKCVRRRPVNINYET